MQKVLVTGANGFIAMNLISNLINFDSIEIYKYTKDDSLETLEKYIKEVDFIYHLAGVNRTENTSEFYNVNFDLTRFIVDILEHNNLKTPILFSSSIQAVLDNDYGKSKLQAENLILEYSKNNDIDVFIYRLPNVFGKWSKPNYNSVISTWCYNITHDLDMRIDDENKELSLVYIDDVVNMFLQSFLNKNIYKSKDCYYNIPIVYIKKLGEIAKLLQKFQKNRTTLLIPPVGTSFERALYATYLSYLEIDNFSYEIPSHNDNRGSFYEILKTLDSGQFSVSTTKPGITRGNHYHNTKNEKFLVVKGKALIKFRHIVTGEKISYEVSDKKLEIVEMIPGYTHNITNIGNETMILLIWANEVFDNNNPDTFYLEV